MLRLLVVVQVLTLGIMESPMVLHLPQALLLLIQSLAPILMAVSIPLVLRLQFMPFLFGVIYNRLLQVLFVLPVVLIFMDKYMKEELPMLIFMLLEQESLLNLATALLTLIQILGLLGPLLLIMLDLEIMMSSKVPLVA